MNYRILSVIWTNENFVQSDCHVVFIYLLPLFASTGIFGYGNSNPTNHFDLSFWYLVLIYDNRRTRDPRNKIRYNAVRSDQIPETTLQGEREERSSHSFPRQSVTLGLARTLERHQENQAISKTKLSDLSDGSVAKNAAEKSKVSANRMCSSSLTLQEVNSLNRNSAAPGGTPRRRVPVSEDPPEWNRKCDKVPQRRQGTAMGPITGRILKNLPPDRRHVQQKYVPTVWIIAEVILEIIPKLLPTHQPPTSFRNSPTHAVDGGVLSEGHHTRTIRL